ncbi:MAG: tripartite tricarboxylate transporter substrate binding protein [Alphaproteobacteria bacterium]|nr:tripartite tricarboxylate transporter substrate binding protein [Alphaproteobacteria bacterium]
MKPVTSIAVRTIAMMALAASAAPLLSASAQAQQWPTRPVKFVVPFAPGAGADIGARLAADKLQKVWGQGVVVENRPGGDSLIAIRQIVTANDDHQLYFGPSGNFTPHPYRHAKLGYNRKTDLLPIARYSNTLLGVAVATSLNINNLKDFVAHARANPGKLNAVVVPGITEFVWDGFTRVENVNITKVPYKNLVEGANEMGTGRIQVSMASLAILQPCMQGNICKLIAVTGRERVGIYKDVPTAAEAGVPSLALEGLVGVFGPKSMSLELRRRIGAQIEAVARDPDIAGKLTATGQQANPGGADEFTRDIEQQEDQVAGIAKVLGLPRKD